MEATIERHDSPSPAERQTAAEGRFTDLEIASDIVGMSAEAIRLVNMGRKESSPEITYSEYSEPGTKNMKSLEVNGSKSTINSRTVTAGTTEMVTITADKETGELEGIRWVTKTNGAPDYTRLMPEEMRDSVGETAGSIRDHEIAVAAVDKLQEDFAKRRLSATSADPTVSSGYQHEQ